MKSLYEFVVKNKVLPNKIGDNYILSRLDFKGYTVMTDLFDFDKIDKLKDEQYLSKIDPGNYNKPNERYKPALLDIILCILNTNDDENIENNLIKLFENIVYNCKIKDHRIINTAYGSTGYIFHMLSNNNDMSINLILRKNN